MSKLVGFEKGDLMPGDNDHRERERVIVVMPDDDLQDASASEEPVVLVVTGEDETTTQPKIAVPPFGPFGFNLLSKEQRIQALWKEYENEHPPSVSYWVNGTPAQWSCTVAGCKCGTHGAESIADRYKRIGKSEWFLKSCEDKSTGGLEHLVNETGWAVDCIKWRGRVLTGLHQHYCFDWDDLPMDDTCKEWPCGCAEYESAANQVNGGINE